MRDVLRAINLRARIGELSLNVQRLEVRGKAALVGRNGSGKTTLLRVIAGHLKPLEGSVYVDGEDVTRLEPEERPIAIVPQRPVRLPMKPLQQLRYFAYLWGTDYEPVVERLNLGRLLRKTGLSVGENQLLTIATALMKRPKVLLLDEPTSSLDWPAKQLVWNAVRELEIPVLYVTHDPLEAIRVAEEIFLLEEGELRGSVENSWREIGEELSERIDLYRLIESRRGA